jgi:urease accessory protein
MTFRLQTFLPMTATFAFAPSIALAHTGHGDTSGFVHGLAHPVFGVDHVLVMVMIGIFAVQLAGRSVWAVPVAFLSAMALGGLLGLLGVATPIAEAGIIVSIVGLAAIIMFRVKMPVAAAVAMSGFFAIFHGHAHGTELPGDGSAVGYAAGFLVSTALLHVAGLGFGLALQRGRQGEWSSLRLW